MKIINIDYELKIHVLIRHCIINYDIYLFRSDSELSDSSSNISLPSLEEFSTCANDEDAPISISSTDSFKETQSLHLSSQEDSIVILSSPESVSNSPTSKAYQDLSDSSSSSGHDFDQRYACDNRSSVT